MDRKLKEGTTGASPAILNSRDWFTGTFVIGKSGCGKSTLLMYWWEQDGHFNTTKATTRDSRRKSTVR